MVRVAVMPHSDGLCNLLYYFCPRSRPLQVGGGLSPCLSWTLWCRARLVLPETYLPCCGKSNRWKITNRAHFETTLPPLGLQSSYVLLGWSRDSSLKREDGGRMVSRVFVMPARWISSFKLRAPNNFWKWLIGIIKASLLRAINAQVAGGHSQFGHLALRAIITLKDWWQSPYDTQAVMFPGGVLCASGAIFCTRTTLAN